MIKTRPLLSYSLITQIQLLSVPSWSCFCFHWHLKKLNIIFTITKKLSMVFTITKKSNIVFTITKKLNTIPLIMVWLIVRDSITRGKNDMTFVPGQYFHHFNDKIWGHNISEGWKEMTDFQMVGVPNIGISEMRFGCLVKRRGQEWQMGPKKWVNFIWGRKAK